MAKGSGQRTRQVSQGPVPLVAGRVHALMNTKHSGEVTRGLRQHVQRTHCQEAPCVHLGAGPSRATALPTLPQAEAAGH